MTRKPDWSALLFNFLEGRREKAHAWGTNDCCIFCADAILEMTGTDLAIGFRDTYSDKAGAAAVLAEYGGIEGLITHFLGEPKGALCARQGDVALIKGPNGFVAGICEGNHVVCPGDTGTRLFPLAAALKSWRVG